jgi:hypothetical protein
VLGTKATLRRYAFEFSCLLRESKPATSPGGKLVHGFLEGAHFYVEIDFTVRSYEEIGANPPSFSKAVEKIEDLIDRRFEGCPILSTPLGEIDPSIPEIEALTQGRVYLMRRLDSDAFAAKFFAMAGSHAANVAVEEVRVRRAGDDYTAIHRETDDEA